MTNTKLYKQFLLFVTFLIFIFIVVYFYKLNGLIVKRENSLKNSSLTQYKIIQSEFENVKSNIEYLGSSHVRDFLMKNSSTIAYELKEEFMNFSKTNNLYDQLRVLDKDGQELIRIDNKGNKPILLPSNRLQNKKDRYYFKDAVSMPSGDTYISKLDLNKEYGEIERPIKPMIRFVKPIFNEKLEFVGTLILNYKAKKLIDKIVLESQKKDFKIYWLNEKGQILLHPDQKYNWSFMYKKSSSLKLQDIESKLWGKIVKFHYGLFTINKDRYFVSTYYPYSILLNSTNIRMDSYSYKWYIVHKQSYSFFAKQTLDDLLDYMPMFILLFIIGLIVLWQMNSIRKSLNEEKEKTNIALMTFDNTSQGIFITDSKNKIIQVNKAFTDILGYSFEDVVNKNPKYLKSGKTKVDVYKDMWQNIRKNNSWEGILLNRKKSGEEYPCLLKINVLKDEKNTIKKYIAVFSDITEQVSIQENLKKQNKEIRESKLKIQETMDELKSAQSQMIQSEKMAALGQLIAGIAHEINTPLGAISSSATNINNALSSLLLQTLELILDMDDNLRELFLDVIKNDIVPISSVDIVNQRVIKKELITQVKVFEVSNPRRVADILISATLHEKLEKISPLLYAKESKEILDTINKMCSITINTNNIEYAVLRASRIVKALKNFSHKGSDDSFEKGSINKGIETVLEIYHNQIKREIILVKEYGELNPILCHFDQLNQVWTNIIQNAIQSMNYKGELYIKTYENEKYQIVQIEDTGIGMTNEVKEKIFNPFYTTKPMGEGTGLGLDIVNKIVEKHNGKIEVESILDKGTTFTIYIDKNLKDDDE